MLSYLVKRVNETQVGECCNELCAKILDGSQELLDIYSIGLKKLISDVPFAMGDIVVESVGPKILKKAISNNKSNEIVLIGFLAVLAHLPLPLAYAFFFPLALPLICLYLCLALSLLRLLPGLLFSACPHRFGNFNGSLEAIRKEDARP